MKPYDAVVFDFDLTLVDSVQAAIACYDYAARAFGLTPPDADTAGRLIGTPVAIAFEQLYHENDAARADEFARLFQAHADEVMTGLTIVLPGVADALRALQAIGAPLAIVSQKRHYRIDDVLGRAGLLDAFAVIVGAEDAPAYKPDPRGLLLALERLGAPPNRGLYVGDTTIDAETASRAGVPFLGVLSGFTSRDDFAPLSPVAILDSVVNLPAFLAAAALTEARNQA